MSKKSSKALTVIAGAAICGGLITALFNATTIADYFSRYSESGWEKTAQGEYKPITCAKFQTAAKDTMMVCYYDYADDKGMWMHKVSKERDYTRYSLDLQKTPEQISQEYKDILSSLRSSMKFAYPEIESGTPASPRLRQLKTQLSQLETVDQPQKEDLNALLGLTRDAYNYFYTSEARPSRTKNFVTNNFLRQGKESYNLAPDHDNLHTLLQMQQDGTLKALTNAFEKQAPIAEVTERCRPDEEVTASIEIEKGTPYIRSWFGCDAGMWRSINSIGSGIRRPSPMIVF